MSPRTTAPRASAAFSGDRPSEAAPAHPAAAHGAGPASLAIFGAVALLLLGFGGYGVWVVRSAPDVGPAAYERVRAGMGREEVQAALGLPAGDYRDDAHKPGGRRYTELSEQEAEEELGTGDAAGRLAWEGNAYSIVVGFDEAGLVRWKTLWRHVPPTPRGPVEKALAWLTP